MSVDLDNLPLCFHFVRAAETVWIENAAEGLQSARWPRQAHGARETRRDPDFGASQRQTCWLWLYCRACGRGAPVALAPFIIRWGAKASSDVLRRSGRCGDCGGKGVTLMNPSWQDMQTGLSPFPVERMP
jgi:hypothetical protein